MTPRLLRIGASATPVVVIDDFTGDAEAVARLAEGLAPFPAATSSYYPGVRRVLEESDGAAFDYALRCCRDAAQFIAGAFGVDRFNLAQASFSMVSTQPAQLNPWQRAPHFDSPDPLHLAMLHYLRVPVESGTAFYRQRETGIERVDQGNEATFVRAATAAAARQSADAGYIYGSDPDYELLESVDAVPDRLLIYQGGLLHSGVIPAGMPLSADPKVGRLTANFFLQG
ncbi:hypothetical protein HMF7854_02700 [Sphingomonas ginkgonis]|uniref:Uncharacterized protein n=1 Tax=Sphingomonas ginkgonis TaxID=2315330 RepID=A0A3R9WME5_9SPHN|nr:DUF6445 family protein [Sphingomonas ginkgonis]RST29854.1 hypothetical protein HMF7854_02700 [Sphingomonas ginkgonis]